MSHANILERARAQRQIRAPRPLLQGQPTDTVVRTPCLLLRPAQQTVVGCPAFEHGEHPLDPSLEAGCERLTGGGRLPDVLTALAEDGSQSFFVEVFVRRSVTKALPDRLDLVKVEHLDRIDVFLVLLEQVNAATPDGGHCLTHPRHELVAHHLVDRSICGDVGKVQVEHRFPLDVGAVGGLHERALRSTTAICRQRDVLRIGLGVLSLHELVHLRRRVGGVHFIDPHGSGESLGQFLRELLHGNDPLLALEHALGLVGADVFLDWQGLLWRERGLPERRVE